MIEKKEYTSEQIKKAFVLAKGANVVAYSTAFLGYVWVKKSTGLFTTCPFHIENTPSMSFFKKANKVRCFGCGKNASIIDLVMQHFDISNTDAAILICEDMDFDFER